jgi:hypothetical protein
MVSSGMSKKISNEKQFRDNLHFIGSCQVRLDSLKDQLIHKRSYKICRNGTPTGDLLVNLLFVEDFVFLNSLNNFRLNSMRARSKEGETLIA